jgi:16S rRNA (adenine1518-N6/adenine1519-N6)-dimethyltransferase
MSLYRHTKELLQSAGCRPRKRLGQNFLVDARVLEFIIEAGNFSSEDVVLEIGAGTGVLTQRLAMSSGRVIAVELDAGLFRILQSRFQANPNVTLIHADILDLDLLALTGSELKTSSIKVVGNLPYYITKPILMKMLDASSLIRMILVMVQEEVGARIIASPGTKDYGALSIAATYRSDVEILRRVPASSFYPKPKVDSVLLRLNVRSQPAVDVKDEELFFQIVRSAFQYRRKILRNALLLAIRAGEMQLPENSVDEALQASGIDPRVRGEKLSKEEFAELANKIRAMRIENE